MAWPDDRPGTYDDDKTWDELNDAWAVSDGKGGALYTNRLIVVGRTNNDGTVKIYFGEV